MIRPAHLPPPSWRDRLLGGIGVALVVIVLCGILAAIPPQ